MAEISQRKAPPAGWYPHAATPGAQRYWDGDKWTDHIAPVMVAPKPQGGVSAFTIALGVALGIASLLAVLWFVDTAVSSNDGLECAIRNAERATGDRAGPDEYCPD